jgi:hypothetical protein
MYVDVDIDLYCAKCGHYVDDDEVYCAKCAGEKKDDSNELLKKLAPYVTEATLLQSVWIPGELAYEIKMFLRGQEK